MPQYLRPGVYIEELSDAYGPRARTMPTVDPTTAVELLRAWSMPWSAVFLGFTADGPVGEPVLVTRWSMFEWTFRGHADGLVLPLSVYTFFAAGGQSCWIVRLPPEVHQVAELVDAMDRLRDTLESISPVGSIALPDAVAMHRTGVLGYEELAAVQMSLVAHCEMSGGVAVLDAPYLSAADDVVAWRGAFRFDSATAVVAHPWLVVGEAGFDDEGVVVPPAGAVSSLWSTADDPTYLVPGLEPVEILSVAEAARLRNAGVIPISATVAGRARIDGDVRATSRPIDQWAGDRVVSSIFRAIEDGTSWAVFRQAGPALWRRLETEIASFLDVLWRRGHLIGDAADAAYHVQCDEGTNTAEDFYWSRVITAVEFRTAFGGQRHIRVVHQLQ